MIRAFAERVLFGEALADKLAPPVGLLDEAPGLALLRRPDAPGRPLGLRFDDPRPKAPSPRRGHLVTEEGRGRVLHGFANHELLALELMALMLLRFPEAPEGWRKGLVVTMQDEQRHLQLYLDRMAACGVEPGAVPVSSFFWDTLADAADPLAFTAAMGLGFEQANLDFARTWSPAFRQAGDRETAEVLDLVYADEIRHVRHGVSWYQRLSGQPLDYAGWAARLVFPMSPARARGPHVDRDGRRRAGIPDAYTHALEVSGTSRGRPPKVYQFRAGVEEEVGGRPASKAARAIQHDLQHLPLLVAHSEDALIAEPAAVDFLQGLRNAGFTPCEVLDDVGALGDRVVGGLEPWGWSPAAAHDLGVEAPDPAWAGWWRKDRVVGWQAGLGAVRCTSRAEVAAALPEGPWIIKAVLSASGTRRVRGEGDEVPGRVQAWLDADGAVVVQRWRERVLDLSVHGDVRASGVSVQGVVRFETGASGAFRGAYIGPWTYGLPSELQRFAHAPATGAVQGQLEAAWTEVAEAARADGYRGPLGVDAMIVRGPEGLELVPVVEANPRWTMGRIALLLRRRVSGRARGWWRFRPVGTLEGGAEAWLAAAQAQCPLRFDGGKLLEGVVATNDPAVARAVLTVLELGER